MLVALAFAAISSAHAYEVLDLKSDAGRVGVVVLTYEDQWVSYAGEALYDAYLRSLMGRRYSRLYVARGKLEIADVQSALRAALSTGLKVDFMTSTHSDSSSIRLHKGLWARPQDIIQPVLLPGQSDQLDLAANFGCDSDGQLGQFTSLGFRSYVAHRGISVGAVAMRAFLKGWLLRCDSLSGAVARANHHLVRLFSVNPVAKLLFRLLAKRKEYTAVMVSFGEDQSICD